MKKLASIALLLLSTACASTSMTDSAGSSGNGQSGWSGKEVTHYVLLSDPDALRDIDYSRPQSGLHVKGRPSQQGFQPSAKVEGSGRLCADGADWVSLADGKIHSAGEGTPSAPYLMGCKTSSGGFVPSTREVVLQ